MELMVETGDKKRSKSVAAFYPSSSLLSDLLSDTHFPLCICLEAVNNFGQKQKSIISLQLNQV